MPAKASKPKMTRGQRVIAFIETYCRVPEGKHVGKPVKLAAFQRAFILDVYDNPRATTRRGILSTARKQGKTALIACLMLAHLVGPEAITNSQIVSGALSREQAAVVFALASKMVDLNPDLSAVCRIIPSSKKIIGLPRNVEYKALAADGRRAHGASPVLAILDETGQVRGPTSAFVDAITTAQGAHESPLLLVISTQAPSDADMLSLWIDDAMRGDDPSVVVHLHTAPKDCELDDEAAMAAANPALDLFRDRTDLVTQLREAMRVPALEASRRNLLLNQRVSLESLWLAPSVWKGCGAAPDLGLFRDPERPIAIGLDLSARNDLTAAVLAARDDEENVHLLPFVFTPLRGLAERALRDRAPYELWVKQGQLIAIDANSIDYDIAAEWLKLHLAEMGIEPTIVAFDRWRIDIFKKAAEAVGLFTGATWTQVGQGFVSMGPRVEAFETLLLNGRVKHGHHPLLSMAAANAIAVRNPAGDRKLEKAKSVQRIDPLQAAVMAAFEVSEGAAAEVNVLDWIA